MAAVLGIVIVFLIVVALIQIARNTTNQLLQEKPEDVVRIATYNVHYIRAGVISGPWSVGDWERRKQPITEAVSALDADIIAFQEMESFARGNAGENNLTRSWLLKTNPEFTAGAVGDSKVFPSTQPIFYRSEMFELVEQGWFFFSETPDVVYSRTYNGSYPAFASWIQLKEKATNKIFRVVNIHVDFSSRSNRFQSIDLVTKRIAPWQEAGEDVLVVGDFNARLGSKTHEMIERTGLQFAPVVASTYHFNRGLHLFGAIDHVAYPSTFKISGKPVVVQKKFNNEWPTDHYPVVVDLQWK